jgi:hypothetical protein
MWHSKLWLLPQLVKKFGICAAKNENFRKRLWPLRDEEGLLMGAKACGLLLALAV